MEHIQMTRYNKNIEFFGVINNIFSVIKRCKFKINKTNFYKLKTKLIKWDFFCIIVTWITEVRLM